ncbi:MAG: response regulator [Candidatus Sumerlaeota bacterium]|nr:response regulator [Candidatus Sumerlaeota bacterium]
MRILVVDDDDIAREIACKVLSTTGHDIVRASDGVEALEIVRKGEIQVVVSDWVMPRMDGIELCQQIRSGTSMGYIYFILVTARSSREDLISGLAAGADDFITKPFDPAEMLMRLNTAQRVLALETSQLTIFSLARLAESRDNETGMHLERMRSYSRALASHIASLPETKSGLSPNYAELIYQTSPLHDIGKVGIPDNVLQKPGRYNEGEYAIMKRHTSIGAETLGAALQKYPGADYLRLARDIAWAHHECVDGDALTMKRCYKPAYPHEQARQIILDGKSKQFDALVVDAFLFLEQEFIAIKEHFNEKQEAS